MSMRDWLATNSTAEELERWGAVTVLALTTLIDNLTPDEGEEHDRR